LYKQTVLGFTWAIINPVFHMLIFSVVFGSLAKIDSDGVPYPIFSYTALIPWTFFATSLTFSSTSLVSAAGMIGKIYFPRIVLPLAATLARLVDFLISFFVLVVLMFYYHITPNWNVLALPLLIVIVILTASGMGIWLSALAVQYRDIKHASQFIVQLMMYCAPVVWPVSKIAEKWPHLRLPYGLYPMAGVIEGFRASLIGTTPMPWDLIAVGGCSALIIFVSSLFFFYRMERYFADVA
jgi:lipopolysaccharide transport system permease protein